MFPLWVQRQSQTLNLGSALLGRRLSIRAYDPLRWFFHLQSVPPTDWTIQKPPFVVDFHQIGATHRLDDTKTPFCGGFSSNWCHPPIGFYAPLGFCADHPWRLSWCFLETWPSRPCSLPPWVLAILHSKLVPPTDWMINPPFMVYFPPIAATHRLVHRLVLSRDMAFPAMQSSALAASNTPLQFGATHRLDDDPPCGGFPSNWCHPPIGFSPPLGFCADHPWRPSWCFLEAWPSRPRSLLPWVLAFSFSRHFFLVGGWSRGRYHWPLAPSEKMAGGSPSNGISSCLAVQSVHCAIGAS
jgi:hypothetical protein